MSIIKRYFGNTADGREAELFITNNSKGMSVELTNYGATVVSIKVPDKNGKIEDVV